MIKKYLIYLSFIFFATNVCAGFAGDRLYRFPNEDFVYKTMIDFFGNRYVDAYALYYDRLSQNRFLGITAEDIWDICQAGGLNIEIMTDKGRCNQFKNELIKGKYKYYDVCKNKGVSKGTEHCIDVFSGIEVQYAQAKNLAATYAKEKFNDSIICNPNIRPEVVYASYMGAVIYEHDYIQCTSVQQKNTYYEFEFRDATESDVSKNQYVWREFARGLCLIYDGQPEPAPLKAQQTILDERGRADFDVKCNGISSCDWLQSKISHFGYSVNPQQDTCVISHNLDNIEHSDKGFSDDYYALFDGHNFTIFYKNNVLKSWPAVSGRGKTPKDSRPTICQRPEYQSCEKVGPIPAGEYYINQNDIEYWENIKIGNYNTNTRKIAIGSRGIGVPYRRPDHSESWGDARVLLNPFDETNLYGRKPDMYIHGGDYAGSAGCIDLIGRIMDFMNWFDVQTDFSSLKVIVDYGSNVNVCKYCDENEPCYPCRCIKDEEVEEKCEYT